MKEILTYKQVGQMMGDKSMTSKECISYKLFREDPRIHDFAIPFVPNQNLLVAQGEVIPNID